jgi:hypothetical protein
MSELNYIGAGDLVFNSNRVGGIHSGGFSVDSIMMRAGMSPIRTLNGGADTEGFLGGSGQVSDLFGGGLAVPAHLLSYNNRIDKGKYKEVEHDDSDSDDSVVDDDLHDRLLELVKEHNAKVKAKEKEELISKKKITRRMKTTGSKKSLTKRRK